MNFPRMILYVLALACLLSGSDGIGAAQSATAPPGALKGNHVDLAVREFQAVLRLDPDNVDAQRAATPGAAEF